MTKVLITGATGNVGKEVIAALNKRKHSLDLYAGVRDLLKQKNTFNGANIQLTQFDFSDASTHRTAFQRCDILFLVRPPHISDVERYIQPIIEVCKEGVKHIIFLSVQGADKSTIIPHHKIEKLIVESKIPYTFLRPAYFMQNFTTTLRDDIVKHQRIYLPAGKAPFTLIDVRDIGEVTADVLMNISLHRNRAYDLTSKETLTFSEMAGMITLQLGRNIQFISPNPLRFFLEKRKENMPAMMILVMIMLHYFPRFQKVPETTDWVDKITGRRPIPFEQFVNEYKILFTECSL